MAHDLRLVALGAIGGTWIFSYLTRTASFPALASGFVLIVWAIMLLGWLNARFYGKPAPEDNQATQAPRAASPRLDVRGPGGGGGPRRRPSLRTPRSVVRWAAPQTSPPPGQRSLPSQRASTPADVWRLERFDCDFRCYAGCRRISCSPTADSDFDRIGWWRRGIGRLSEIRGSCCCRTCGTGCRRGTRCGW